MRHTCPLLLFPIFLLLNLQIHAANRYWISTATSNWNNAANWSNSSGGTGGATIPGAGDNVNFDNNGTGNCTIDVSVSVNKITVTAGYTGTISQGTNALSTSGTASFSGGVFAGGTANITFGGNFTLNGAVFTSTTTVLEFDGNSAFTSGVFNHNNGTVRYVATGGGSTISGLSPTLYILEFSGEGFTYTISSAGDIIVLNNLNLTGTLSYNINAGVIDVNGDINISNSAAGCGGTATVNIIGAGVQNWNGSAVAGQGALPKVTINKPGGVLNLSNYPGCSNAFAYTAGTVNAGTSTWCFTDGTAGNYSITGSLGFNNINFLAITPITFAIAAGTTISASGDISLTGTTRITINTGTVNVNGNLLLTNSAGGGGGSATMNIVGTGNQTIDASTLPISACLLPIININKPSGTLTLKGIISEANDWTYVAGTVDASTFAATVAFGGTGLNVTSNGMSFYHVTVTGNTISLLDNMTIGGNLNIAGGKLAPGANAVNLSGNWNDFGGGFTKGTSTVNFNGSALQTITAVGGEIFAGLTINNTGAGIQLINSSTISTTLTMTLGNIDLNGNSLALGISVANNGTLSYSSGTIINTGSFTRWFKAAAIAGNTGLFPVGTSSNYRPIFVTSTANPTTGGNISVSYTDATANSVVMFPDGASTVWTRKDLTWAMSTATLAGGTYSLQVQGTGLGLIGSVSDLRLTLANSVVATAGVNGGTTSNPQVNRTGLSLANLTNTFYVGSVNPGATTLPIKLLYFRGSLVNGKVLLAWATSDQMDNARFTIQRSKNSGVWEDIQQIDGAGTGNVVNAYSATDPSPLDGASLYRLKQEDADRNISYSPVISIERGPVTGGISISPSPATDHFTINFPLSENYVVQVLNCIGQPVQRPVVSTGSSTVVRVSDLPAGVYFVRIISHNRVDSRTVLVK